MRGEGLEARGEGRGALSAHSGTGPMVREPVGPDGLLRDDTNPGTGVRIPPMSRYAAFSTCLVIRTIGVATEGVVSQYRAVMYAIGSLDWMPC